MIQLSYLDQQRLLPKDFPHLNQVVVVHSDTYLEKCPLMPKIHTDLKLQF